MEHMLVIRSSEAIYLVLIFFAFFRGTFISLGMALAQQHGNSSEVEVSHQEASRPLIQRVKEEDETIKESVCKKTDALGLVGVMHLWTSRTGKSMQCCIWGGHVSDKVLTQESGIWIY